MQKLFAGIFALIWILAATAQPDEHYCNARFGFCVDVPAPLKSAGEGENGDGSKFYVPGKAVEVIASASHYVADDAPQQWLQQQKKEMHKKRGQRITFEQLKKDRYTVSGYLADGDIFYHAWRIENDIVYSLYFAYPRQEKTRMNAVVEQMVKSWETALPTEFN